MNLFFKKNKQDDKKRMSKAGQRQLLSYQVANLQGIGTRERQEDSFAFANVLDVTEIRKKGMLAVVADGMGGMEDGKQASEIVIARLREAFEKMNRKSDLSRQLCESVYMAGDEVFRILDGNGGSTVVACILFQEKLYFTSVGDSFLFLKRGKQLFRLNREQNCRTESYLQAIRCGNIDPSRGQNHWEGDALTQFLGMRDMKEVDFLRRPFALRDEDVLLICSDGVGGVLTEQEILDSLGKQNPTKMCEAIEEQIWRQERDYQDNYTALIIQCGY